jgi:hypothetical protein
LSPTLNSKAELINPLQISIKNPCPIYLSPYHPILYPPSYLNLPLSNPTNPNLLYNEVSCNH